MKHRFNNLLTIISLFILTQGCQCASKLPRSAKFIGYIQMVSPGFVSDDDIKLINTDIDEALTTRDLKTNALSVVFSPAPRHYINTSLIPNTRTILLRLKGSQCFPKSAPKVFIPLLTSGGFSLRSADTSPSGEEILIEAAGSEADIDLLCSFLVSPGGIQGVATFPGIPSATIIHASFFNPSYKLLKLYSINKRNETDLYLESLVELPLKLNEINLSVKGKIYSVKVLVNIPSWGFTKVRLPCKVESGDWATMNIYTSLRTCTGKQFKQFTSKPQENEKE